MRKGHPRDSLFLGYAFPWSAAHTQTLETFLALEGALPVANDHAGGHPALHAVGQRQEAPLYLPLSELSGHVEVTGATGSGKTKLLEMLTEEAVACPGATVVMDPKGSRTLLARCAAAAHRQRKPFACLLLASPAASASMNILATCSTPAEVAARVSALMPPGTRDPFFREYPLALIENIAGALQVMSIPWTLEGLYRPAIFYNDLEYLTMAYLDELGPYKTVRVKGGRLDSPDYRRAGVPDLIADALLEDLAHNREHFTKITSTLRPAFRGVIGAPLGPIFSPPASAEPPLTWTRIAQDEMVVYVGLASMLFPDIANRVGRVILQDFIGFLGRRYAYEDLRSAAPITLLIDEVARVAYDGFATVMAMSREAGGRFVLAQQSQSDMEATLNNQAQARQIHENCNTRIWCRVTDETAKLASEGLPECTVYVPRPPHIAPDVSHSYGGVGGLSGNARAGLMPLTGPVVRLDWFTALPRGQAFVRMRGEVWKLRWPLLVDVLEAELEALGLIALWGELKRLEEAMREQVRLPAPPRGLLAEHTLEEPEKE